MPSIVPIKGQVKFPITLDPTVWIFDDRKIEKDVFFDSIGKESEPEAIASSGDQMGLREGIAKPPVNKSIKRYEREKILRSSYVIPLLPFINNAEPLNDATAVQLGSENGSATITLEEAKHGVLAFSETGKPLTEDGPVYFYYGDGSNKEMPIKGIDQIIFI